MPPRTRSAARRGRHALNSVSAVTAQPCGPCQRPLHPIGDAAQPLKFGRFKCGDSRVLLISHRKERSKNERFENWTGVSFRRRGPPWHPGSAGFCSGIAEGHHGRRPCKQQQNNRFFLELARKALKWEEPAEPVEIAGPIYFVGTKGLGAFLITTSEGDILMNTGMPYFLEMLKPDIWLAQPNEYYDLEGKRQRSQTDGVSAWIDPEGYRRWLAGKNVLSRTSCSIWKWVCRTASKPNGICRKMSMI